MENAEDPDNQTAFFKDFDEDEETEECNQLYKSYRYMNAETLAGLGK